MALNPAKTVSNPRIAKLIELEVAGRIKPEHQQELDTYRAQGVAPKSGAGGTESERTAAFLGTRLVGALNTIGDVRIKDPGNLSPGYFPNAVGKVFGETAQNIATPESRQRVEAAQLEALDSALTLGTGAAYTKEQLEGYRKAYFPQLGDEPAAIADKQQRLRTVVEAARVKAGASAPDIDKALKAAGWVEPEAGLGAERPIGVSEAVDEAIGLNGPANRPNVRVDIQGGGGARGAEFEQQRSQLLAAVDAATTPEARAQAQAALRTWFAANNNVQLPGNTNPDGAVGSFARGAGDTLTMGFLDELGGVADTVGDAFGGRLQPGGFGNQLRDNILKNRMTLENDANTQGGARLGGQLVGGLALPVIGGEATIANLARTGAAYGGAYGVGSADGGVGDRAIGGLISAGLGAAGGAGLGALASRLGRGGGGGRPPPVGLPVAEAAERQGIELTRPDIAPGARGAYSLLESLPISGGRVARDMQRGTNQIEQRVLEQGGGQAVPRERAGEIVADAGRRYIDRSRRTVNRLYDRAASDAGDPRVRPTQAINTIDRNLAELSETPTVNQAKIGVLNRLRQDLVDENGAPRALSIQGLRDLRTAMRDEISAQGLRYTDAERRVTQAVDAASNDIASRLTGPARRAYQRADTAHRERVDMIDNVVKKFIGPRNAAKSSEQTMATLQNMAAPNSGDAARLDRMIQTLEPNERADVASSIASVLGRRNLDDDATFSPALFFSQVSKYSDEARRAVFGQQGADNLADLARIAEARGQVQTRMNNSGSGRVSNWMQTIKGLMGGGAAAGLGAAAGVGAGSGAATAAAGLGAAYVTARVLGSPRAVQALLRAARANTPPLQQRAIRQLGQVASREPAIANDIALIQQRLQSAMGSGSAVAGEPGERRQ